MYVQEGTIIKDASFSGIFPAREKRKELLVFLVDDDLFFLEALSFFIKDSFPGRIRVRTFASAQECVHALAERPDLVVLDYFFEDPSFTGLTALKEFQATWPVVPVVMVSGQDDVECALETLREGAEDYFVKDGSTHKKIHQKLKELLDSEEARVNSAADRALENRSYFLMVLTILLLFILSRITR